MTQSDALTILKMGYNCYITGAAGSGKTHLVNEYVAFLRQHGVGVGITASTGIAATHIGGMTIHSWSGLGIRSELTEHDLEEMEDKKYLHDRFSNTDVLILDEISMIHHFRLDLVDRIARHLKKNNRPFGGMQVIVCGDFFQLPPVSRPGERESLFAYHAEVWKKFDLKICYLEEQHRHTDETFIAILNGIRTQHLSDASLDRLKSRFNSALAGNIAPTKLHTHNVNVDAINDRELNKLPGLMYTFSMESRGNKALVEALKKSCLAPEVVRLKIGARVMFVKNNFDAGYANGTLGTVIECSHFGPTIQLVSGKTIAPEKESWIVEEDGTTKATITQYPLRLAWAITVHKSQGMSLDAVEVDLSQSFERGMGYVALSRVRALSGLRLIGLNKNALEVREDISLFDEDLQEQSDDDVRWLQSLDRADIKKQQETFLKKIATEGERGTERKKKQKRSPLEETKILLEQGMGLAEMRAIKGVTTSTLLDHIEKIIAADPTLRIDHLKREVPAGKFKKAWMAFKTLYGENRDFLLSPVKNKLGPSFSYEELRIVRLFVR